MPEDTNTKQVIVMRKFKGLRTGKYISQACHASMAFLTMQGEMIYDVEHVEHGEMGSDWTEYFFKNSSSTMEIHFRAISDWLKASFKKIVVYVNSEKELDEIYQRALYKGLMAHLVIDNGLTEFNGVPTKTCVAIGPAFSDKFIGLTDHLPLL